MRMRSNVLLLALAALLAACAPRETPVEAGIRTHTLIIGNYSEPVSLDPHLAMGTTDQVILAALFEGLTALDEATSQPVPAAATAWDVSPDGLVYTFHLRPDARWSNGEPVTAADFAFSFRRILDPTLAAHYAYMLWPIRNAKPYNTGALADFSDVGIKVVDPATLRLTLERATPYLPALAAHLTWLPVHRATIERYGAGTSRQNPWATPQRHVGNGPFTLAEWRPDDRVVVRRNPHFRDAAHTRLAAVVFLPTETSDADERNFRAGQVHVTALLPPARIAHYHTYAPQLLRCDPFLSTWFIRFNTTRPAFNQPRVRRALGLAIDRQAIAAFLGAGSRQPASTLVPPGFTNYEVPAAAPPDYAAARRLLAETGFPSGHGLPPMEVLVPNSVELTKVAELLQETWRRELGVAVTIAANESKTAFQRQQLLDFDLALCGWVADFADPANFIETFLSGGGNNWTGWSSAEYDRLVTTSSSAPDTLQRFAQLRRAEALLLIEAPIVPLYFDAQVYLIHPAVKGWAPAPLLVRRFQSVSLDP